MNTKSYVYFRAGRISLNHLFKDQIELKNVSTHNAARSSSVTIEGIPTL